MATSMSNAVAVEHGRSIDAASVAELTRELTMVRNDSLLHEDRVNQLTNLASFHREALDAAAIVAVTDRHGKITAVNQKFCQLSGYTPDELIGANHRIVHSGVHDRAFFRRLYRTISAGKVWHDVICNRAKSGKLYWVDTTIVPHHDGSGYTAIRFDVTPQKEAEQRLWRLANIDSLTDLPNRRHFMEMLAAATAAEKPFATAILDLDHFKDVNDSAGHDAGDRLLTAVARELRQAIAEDEVIGRLGGDEFALILHHDGDSAKLRRKLDALVDAAANHIDGSRFGWRVQASVGAATFPKDGVDEGDLLKCADMALYAAKQSGRGCAKVFRNQYRLDAEWRADTRSAIQRALTNGEMFVLYQPIVDLQHDRPAAFEALLRWRMADGEVRTPAAFHDVFDDDRTAADIGLFVLNEVLGQIKRLRREGIAFQSIAINATLGDFRSSTFVDRIIQEVDSGRIGGSQLCVEITEGMLMDRGAQTVWESIDRLNERGVQIAFDDFGTGFASLTHLRQLPIDHVKIDRSFIEAICAGGKDRVIVESVIELAHRLGLRVVAEGVEQTEQATLLRGLACDSIQGFLIAPALCEAGVANFMRDRPSLAA